MHALQQNQPIAYPEWTEYRKKNGLDPLGMQTGSVNVYQRLLPGISLLLALARQQGAAPTTADVRWMLYAGYDDGNRPLQLNGDELEAQRWPRWAAVSWSAASHASASRLSAVVVMTMVTVTAVTVALRAGRP